MRDLAIVSTHFGGGRFFSARALAAYAIARFLPYDVWVKVFSP